MADFGVARALREHVSVEDDPLAAHDSAGLGTLAYMAPERLLGAAAMLAQTSSRSA